MMKCNGCSKKFYTKELRNYHETICVHYNYNLCTKEDEKELNATEISNVVLLMTGLSMFHNKSVYEHFYKNELIIRSLLIKNKFKNRLI